VQGVSPCKARRAFALLPGYSAVMARYEHLPIYKASLDVAVWFEQAVAGFSRYHKYTLGTELRNQSREIVSLVAQANSERDKAPHLKQLRVKLDELLILMRIAKEARAFKRFESYQHAVTLVAGVCRQNEGWLKSVSGASTGAKARGPESGRRRRRSRSERAD